MQCPRPCQGPVPLRSPRIRLRRGPRSQKQTSTAVLAEPLAPSLIYLPEGSACRSRQTRKGGPRTYRSSVLPMYPMRIFCPSLETMGYPWTAVVSNVSSGGMSAFGSTTCGPWHAPISRTVAPDTGRVCRSVRITRETEKCECSPAIEDVRTYQEYYMHDRLYLGMGSH